ncbi:hypothetical protein CERZMDRAFT_94505 [Cercospora zeae-maydis SCOH1-5]|uniref:Uncharacterized protein n=1 Tax=Cercospora zeae-maydis SCOH1-5 TaxID=717836 RepID=A0A6A6FNP7_9PEZI|nr:hypothetical protein CERZMDRAFT_94505 [Cercospora zeae-maydis SCOH1-5]
MLRQVAAFACDASFDLTLASVTLGLLASTMPLTGEKRLVTWSNQAGCIGLESGPKKESDNGEKDELHSGRRRTITEVGRDQSPELKAHTRRARRTPRLYGWASGARTQLKAGAVVQLRGFTRRGIRTRTRP